ncbi:hypothetical protein ACLB2K_038321 [Fragaria x ananassa]
MFEELKGRLKATTIQQSVTDLAEQAKRDKILWEVDQHNLAVLTEDFNQFAGEVREEKDLVKKDVDDNIEALKLTRATMDEQTRSLDEHDAKLQQQQDASFFGSKNNLEKLEEFKEKHDRLNLRVLEVEDWMRGARDGSKRQELARWFESAARAR